jgi:hypothetical protein
LGEKKICRQIFHRNFLRLRKDLQVYACRKGWALEDLIAAVSTQTDKLRADLGRRLSHLRKEAK